MPSYEPIAHPEACPKAFLSDSPAAAVSQAAFYLLLGSLLHPAWTEALHDGSQGMQEAFPLPRVDPLKERLSFDPPLPYWEPQPWRYFWHEPAEWRERAFKAAEELYERPSPESVQRVLWLGTVSPDPLVRVGALITAADHAGYSESFISMLAHELRVAQKEALAVVADVAAVALARLLSFALGSLHQPMHHAFDPGPGGGTKTLLLVNGTMLPSYSIHTGMPETWWRPGGDLHEYLRAGKRPDIYGQPDFYEWEGGYSLYAHEVAAKNLCEWQKHHRQYDLDLVTHSHGGNVVMLATQFGLKVNRLVFLSCPVHWSLRQPNFSNVGSLQSVRIKHDLVLMADRAAQKFPDNRIPEDILPYWFISHSYSHESDKWRRHNLDRYV